MVSMTLALFTALPARRALLAGAAALLAAPAKGAATAAAPTLALPAPVAIADPILSAIRAHRRAWAAFQVAPDDEASEAEEVEYEAAQALLGVACGTRAGAHALIAHFRWYVAEEADNLLTAGLGGCHLGAQLKARLAELAMFVPEESPPAVIALPAPRGPSPLLAAIETHRSANLAVSQAVRDFVRAEEDGAPDEALMHAIADRASDEEVSALNTLLALTPADAAEVRTRLPQEPQSKPSSTMATDRVAYRINEAAAAIGICRSKLYKLIADGEIKALKRGGVRLIRRIDLEAFIDAMPASRGGPNDE